MSLPHLQHLKEKGGTGQGDYPSRKLARAQARGKKPRDNCLIMKLYIVFSGLQVCIIISLKVYVFQTPKIPFST